MPISVTCACGQSFRAKDEAAGKQLKCPKCGQAVTVPQSDPLGGSADPLGGLGDLSSFESSASGGSGLSSPLGAPGGMQGGGLQQPGMQSGSGQLGGGLGSPSFQQAQAAPAKVESKGSSKTKWILIGSGAGVGVIALVVVLIIVFSGGGDSDPSVASNPTPSNSNANQSDNSDEHNTKAPPEPPAKKPEIKLGELEQMNLLAGGSHAIDLNVDRQGQNGEIRILLNGIPKGIDVLDAPTIADGESVGKLELAADQAAFPEDFAGTIKVTVKIGEATASRDLVVNVKPLVLPTFEPMAEVVMQPGGKASIQVTVNRNDYEGPLEIKLTDLPAKVTGSTAKLDGTDSGATLQLSVAGDAPNVNQAIRATTTLFGKTISADIPLVIDRSPFSVDAFQVVTLRPGKQQSAEVKVPRRSHKGPVELTLTNLPDGVTVEPVQVPAGATSATVVLLAADNAHERVRSSVVTATAGNLKFRDPIVIRVAENEAGVLPKEITENPALSRLIRRGGFGGRLTTKSKQILMDFYGGTEESEAAVMRGLAWLDKHQHFDGSWPLKDFPNGVSGCSCSSGIEGEVTGIDMAGTAFGVLPFLGAGVAPNRSPEEPAVLSKYEKTVRDAIDYLRDQQETGKASKKLGMLDTNMYSHALGTLALCEAYALSNDDDIKLSAQLAIRYILASQHEKGGGWRYGPNQSGDLSVTGWMFLAVRSGQLAGLQILKPPLIRAGRFVDECGAGPKEAAMSQYSYTPGQPPKLTMTAAGLLTREYLGWKRDNNDLIAGAEHMMGTLPPKSATRLGSIYYYYYATQVLHHMGGPNFDLWNHRMREHLIRTQEKSGCEAGSWSPVGCDHGARGGRLYSTSLALTTLQCYYRHLPMYGPSLKQLGTRAKAEDE